MHQGKNGGKALACCCVPLWMFMCALVWYFVLKCIENSVRMCCYVHVTMDFCHVCVCMFFFFFSERQC